MKQIFVIVFLLIGLSSFCQQEVRCDRFYYHGHYIPFDTTGVSFTSDYIRKKGKYANHISNRHNLKEIEPCVTIDGFLSYSDNSTDIGIVIGKRNVNPSCYFDGNYIFNDTGMPYGVFPKDTVVPVIKSLFINDILVPDSVFNDLCRPNIYRAYFSIKPLKVYYSKDMNYIYIYIFGDTYDFEPSLRLSYMAKLIFSIKGKYIGRIVERGSRLNYFRFNNCCDFIGF